MEISSLRQRPEFADTVAHRGWTAWWTDSGSPLSDYRAHLEPMIVTDRLPFGLVAHESDRYLGSVLVIENDLEERPQYRPWIAALWVEPHSRRNGVAAQLLAAARTRARSLGEDRCYLCATPDKTPYYLRQGFACIESDVEGLDVFVI